MASRNRYLVAYDVRNPNRLRRVHHAVRDYGDPIQYSVFLCDLTRLELARLRRRLRAEVNQDADTVAIIDLGPTSGTAPRRIEFIGPAPKLTSDDPFVW